MSVPINRKYITASSVLAIVLMIECVSLVSASRPLVSNLQAKRSMRAISDKCKKSFNGEFGQADLKTINLKNFRGTIDVPCRLRIRPGASIQMTNVILQTNNLIIEDQPQAKRPAHLVINSSQVSSSQGGFQIRLTNKGSTVELNKSKLSYPLSVGISTGQTDKDAKSSVTLNSNQITSQGEQSEGIVIVTTGTAKVTRNSFKLNPGEDALLLGSSCQLVNNLHANDRCNGP
ncbi:MAG: hypothetical protein QG553_777 [Patescibacteria group bacterium]|nr:hypothetical protein [Patescibacteria group bacterium]